MIKVKIDSIKEDDEKKYFYVSAEIGTQRSRSVNFKTKDIVFSVKDVIEVINKENNLNELDFIPSESLRKLKYNSHTGVCVFKKKHVDFSKECVKIDQMIEAEVPQVEEQKNEASLPNGLKKITKTKRKRATKKKKTEE